MNTHNEEQHGRALRRRLEMLSLRTRGWTLDRIGKKYGVTRERVRQVLGTESNGIYQVRRRLDNDIRERVRQDARGQRAIARWWARVERSDDCWEWRGSRFPSGYGRSSMPFLFGSERYAHRQSFYLSRGYIPKRPMSVLHKCNNPSCVRPDHLYEGTQKENVADAIKANGGLYWRSKTNDPRARAEFIVAQRGMGKTYREIARALGLSEHRVSQIARGVAGKWSRPK